MPPPPIDEWKFWAVFLLWFLVTLRIIIFIIDVYSDR